MARIRADLLLVQRGLAESRAKAQAAIEAGGVSAGGRVVVRASDLLEEDADVAVAPPHPWVSRGGVKLAHALEKFGVDPAGRVCLDIGASTGGFTDVLLTLGAAHVTAVDVGRAQMHARIAGDPRVTLLEGMDARALTAAQVPGAPDLIVCDASFIGLAKVLPVPLSLAAARADVIALVKPQFEAGPRAGKRGVLSEALARSVAEGVIASLDGVEGFRVRASLDSPVRGGDGNLELLLHMRRT